MDKVTQSNAAGAEESAAAAEELNAQAMAMKKSVSELLQLIGNKDEINFLCPPVDTRKRKTDSIHLSKSFPVRYKATTLAVTK